MRRFFILWALLFSCILTSAQSVEFRINEGLYDIALKSKIESNVTQFLQECNLAYAKHGPLNLTKVSISDDAVQSLEMLWRNMPFRCDEEMVVERIARFGTDYKIRNIPIEVKDENGKADYPFMVLEIDKNGVITQVNLAINNHIYNNIMSEGEKVRDVRQRQMILDYVEQFRTAYNRKDIDFLENVFSDDALIITGKVIRRKKGDHTAILKEDRQVVYREEDKKRYLNRIKNEIFKNNAYIRVNFSDIKIARHPSIDGYYGVTVRQDYKSSSYADEGYLFMLWDFRNEDNPQIHVRTWQPYWMDDAHTTRLNESDVFGINDFRIQ